jgi:hypothetical protein
MIIERLGQWYAVTCDGCGAITGFAPTEREALELAQEQGWKHEQRWNGQEYVHRDGCPGCDGPTEGKVSDETI